MYIATCYIDYVYERTRIKTCYPNYAAEIIVNTEYYGSSILT